MKVKHPSEKDSANKNSRSVNIFLNLVIVLLAGLVIFLSFSLLTKISALAFNEDETDLNKTPKIIQLEVLNGCGITGIAEKFTNYLRKENFDVVQVGNYSSYDINNTLVVDRTGNKTNAAKVAEAIGVDSKNIIQQINNDYFLDVSVIIGKDFNRLKPFN
ncbi:MAG: LytR family transcriptional regulator [Ignavibacteriales bacterium]|nr:MAG: LytR family transcriptional regulator [Ignavibacteriales bacterium]